MENNVLAPVIIFIDECLELQSVNPADETGAEKLERERIAEIVGSIAEAARKAQPIFCC